MQLANEHRLAVSFTETLKNVIFGIDPQQEKLIILELSGIAAASTTIIDLRALKNCSKQKIHLHIPPDKKENRPEKHLEKIVLSFEFTGDRPPIELIFYEYRYNSLFQMHELEQKADYWSLLISQRMYA